MESLNIPKPGETPFDKLLDRENVNHTPLTLEDLTDTPLPVRIINRDEYGYVWQGTLMRDPDNPNKVIFQPDTTDPENPSKPWSSYAADLGLLPRDGKTQISDRAVVRAYRLLEPET